MEKKHKNPPGNCCPRVLIMHSIGSCSARSKYHLTIKNLVCTHFYGPVILDVWLPDYNENHTVCRIVAICQFTQH